PTPPPCVPIASEQSGRSGSLMMDHDSRFISGTSMAASSPRSLEAASCYTRVVGSSSSLRPLAAEPRITATVCLKLGVDQGSRAVRLPRGAASHHPAVLHQSPPNPAFRTKLLGTPLLRLRRSGHTVARCIDPRDRAHERVRYPNRAEACSSGYRAGLDRDLPHDLVR